MPYQNALTAARRGSYLCSNRSTLFQTTGFGFVVVMPMYATSPTVPPVDQRMDLLTSVLVGIIPLVKVVERAIGTLDYNEIDLIVYDRSAPPATAFLYNYHYEKDAATRNVTELVPSESRSSFFDYGARSFEVACIPSRSLVDTAYSSTPLLIAVGCAILFGILLFLVVLGCLYASMRRAMLRSQQLIQANRNKNLALDLLHEAKRISDEANRSKSDFLAFLCHELRNPLHAIVAMIDFLQAPDDQPDPVTGIVPAHPPLTDSQQESIDTIQSSVRTMASICSRRRSRPGRSRSRSFDSHSSTSSPS